MTIKPALPEQLDSIRRYDSHIPEVRLLACIRNGFVHVIQSDEQIVGVLRHSLFWQTIPFLDLLHLDEAVRGMGIGTRAMAHWESEMRRQGYSYVMLSTQEDETARDFYEKLGYQKIGAFLPPEQGARELMYGKQLEGEQHD